MKPLVSILIPAYNAERFLPQTLLSVQQQTLRPIECVIVNDGSTDSTPRILAQWSLENESDDFQIRIVNQPNAGLVASRAVGVRNSTADYIQFLDADDLIHPQKLSLCVESLQKDPADVLVPATKIFGDDEAGVRFLNSPVIEKPWPENVEKIATVTSHYWHSVGPVFRRSIIQSAAKFPASINGYAEELELHGRIKLSTDRIRYDHRILSYYRKGNSTSITGAFDSLARGRIDSARIAESLLDEFQSEDRNEWRALVRMAMRTYYQTCSVKYEIGLRNEAAAEAVRLLSRLSPFAGRLMSLIPAFAIDAAFRLCNKLRGT